MHDILCINNIKKPKSVLRNQDGNLHFYNQFSTRLNYHFTQPWIRFILNFRTWTPFPIVTSKSYSLHLHSHLHERLSSLWEVLPLKVKFREYPIDDVSSTQTVLGLTGNKKQHGALTTVYVRKATVTAENFHREKQTQKSRSSNAAPAFWYLVGVRGFEPPASTSRT